MATLAQLIAERDALQKQLTAAQAVVEATVPEIARIEPLRKQLETAAATVREAKSKIDALDADIKRIQAEDAALTPPAKLRYWDKEPTRAGLDWAQPSLPGQTFAVEQSADGGKTWKPLKVEGAYHTNAPYLDPTVAYQWRVRSERNGQASPWSTPITRKPVAVKAAEVPVPVVVVKKPQVVEPPPPPPPEPENPLPDGAIAITTLQGARLLPGKYYRLTAATDTYTTTVTIPAGTTLDCTGCDVTFNSDVKYATGVNITGSGVTFRGGTWHAANVTPFDAAKPNGSTIANSQRVWTIAQTASDVVVENLTLAASVDGKADWGGGWIGYGTTRVTVRNLTASRFFAYLVWNLGAVDLTVSGCTVTIGSTNETPLRFHGTTRLKVLDNTITASLFKLAGIRCHEGTDTLVEGNTVVGIVDIGPMGGGDGGEQWGTTKWVDAAGREVAAALADVTATLAKRAGELAKRLNNVTLRDNDITGFLAVEAGITGTSLVEGGTIRPLLGKTGATNIEAQPFNRMHGTYPATAATRLPGDVLRLPPSPPLVLRNVTLLGDYTATDIRARIPVDFTLEGCTYRGVAIPDGPGLLVNW